MIARSPAGLPDPRQRTRICLGWLAGIVPAGLLWRFGPLRLPPFAWKYGGSALWAAAVYWLVAACLPRRRGFGIAAPAVTVAFAVEGFKLVRQPALDHFRTTFLGKVLLGHYFSLGALLAYALAITAAWLLDRWLLDRRLEPGRSSPEKGGSRR